VGAKDYWIEIVNYIIEDLNWLLELPFYRYNRIFSNFDTLNGMLLQVVFFI